MLKFLFIIVVNHKLEIIFDIGWSILVITTHAFVEFTSNSYWAYLCLNDVKAFLIYLLLPQVLFVFVLAYYCSSCFE